MKQEITDKSRLQAQFSGREANIIRSYIDEDLNNPNKAVNWIVSEFDQAIRRREQSFSECAKVKRLNAELQRTIDELAKTIRILAEKITT